MNHLDDATQALIKAGLVDYLDAVRALREFRDILRDECQTILRKHLSDLEKAMGCGKLDLSEIKPFAYPDNHLQSNEEGATLAGAVTVPGLGRLLAGFRVGWESSDPRANVCLIGIPGEKFQRLRNLFGKSEITWDPGVKEIHLLEKLAPNEDPESALAKVETVVQKWIDLCTRVGGLGSVLSPG
jgi:hypothetical protein